MRIRFEVKRYDPAVDQTRYQVYDLELEEVDRVLDGLNYIRWHIDGTLAFRRSC